MLPPTPNEHDKSREIAETPTQGINLNLIDLPLFLLSPRNSQSSHQVAPSWSIDLQTKHDPSREPATETLQTSLPNVKQEPRNSISASTPAKCSQDLDALSDLINGSSSNDLWSRNDTQSLSVNLTSIMEDSDDKEVFFSPRDLFLDSVSKLTKVSPATYSDITSTPSKVKSEPDTVTETPCKKLASKIEILDSPIRSKSSSAYADVLSTQKVWTASLDEELLRCWNKYKVYKSANSDTSIFKYTTRNKILSRMLLSRTSVFRTPKQVSARLQRLMKYKADEAKSTTFSAPNSLMEVRAMPCQGPPTFVPIVGGHPGNVSQVPMDYLNIHEFCMAFEYKDYMLGKHMFAALGPVSMAPPTYEIFSEIAKTIHHQKFLQELNQLSPTLIAHEIPVHNVLCNINFNSQVDTSSPLSPHATSRQISLSNGLFLSYLKIKVPKSHSKESFLAWRSIVTVYKGLDEILLKTEDAINGYKNDSLDFFLQIPFLNNFWSGYLSFLLNGSNTYKDLNDLTILQVICDGEKGLAKIYGYFIYNFNIAKVSDLSINVSMFKLRSDPSAVVQNDDADEVETILAPSSPVNASPEKPSFQPEMRVDVNSANLYDIQGPSTAPLFDSRAIQSVNCNFNSRPAPQQAFPASKSSANIMSASYNDSLDNKRPNMPRHFSLGYVPSQGRSDYFEIGPRANQTVNMSMNNMSNNHDQSNVFDDSQHMLVNSQNLNAQNLNTLQADIPTEHIDANLNLSMIDKPWALNTENLSFDGPEIQSAPATREHFFPNFGDSSEASNDAGQVLKQVHNQSKMTAARAYRRASQKSIVSPSQQGHMVQMPTVQVNQQKPANFHKLPMSLPVMFQPKR